MSNPFDWIRQSQDGAELFATLRYVTGDPKDEGTLRGMKDEKLHPSLGPPPSALDGPCLRCWVYPRQPGAIYCPTCQFIVAGAREAELLARRAVVIWGFVTQLPQQLQSGRAPRDPSVYGAYIHDEHHFLMLLYYRELQAWLRELALYHGGSLKGLLQICPTTRSKDFHMGEMLCRMIYDEARFPADQLRIRFFATPHYVYHPRFYEREGVLTFEASEFLQMLDMAVVFRSVLPPHEQKILRKLLLMDDPSEAQFYWGRFLGCLTQEAKDLLNAWKIRQWSKPQIHLLYALAEYVEFYQSG